MIYNLNPLNHESIQQHHSQSWTKQPINLLFQIYTKLIYPDENLSTIPQYDLPSKLGLRPVPDWDFQGSSIWERGAVAPMGGGETPGWPVGSLTILACIIVLAAVAWKVGLLIGNFPQKKPWLVPGDGQLPVALPGLCRWASWPSRAFQSSHPFRFPTNYFPRDRQALRRCCSLLYCPEKRTKSQFKQHFVLIRHKTRVSISLVW